MKLKKIHIHNLYSYKDASCEFKDYNIIVGPNGSGKTNLARILNIFYKNFEILHKNDVYYKWLTPEKVFINASIVNREIKDGEEAYLILGIELDDEIEIRLFKRMLIASFINPPQDYYPFIDNIKNERIKDIEIALYYYKINLLDLNDGIQPNEILIRLKNGLTLIYTKGGQLSFTYTEKLSDYINNKDKYIFSHEIEKYFGSNEVFSKIAEKVKGLLANNKSEFIKWCLCLDDDKGIYLKELQGKTYEIYSDRFVYYPYGYKSNTDIDIRGQIIISEIDAGNIKTKPIWVSEIALHTLPTDTDSPFPLYHAEEKIVRKMFNLKESFLSNLDKNINLDREQYYLKLSANQYFIDYSNDIHKNNIYSLLDEFILKNNRRFEYYFSKKLVRPDRIYLINLLYLFLLIHLTNKIQINVNTLTDWLYELKNDKDTSDIYKHIQEDFRSIFNLEVDVFKENNDNKKIYFKEGDTYINLEDSASGYLQLLQTLTLINTSHSLVILDEPASSLHPSTIKRLVKYLKEKYEDKQVILITHSPYFLDYDTLFEFKDNKIKFKDNTRLLYITKEKGCSIIKENKESDKLGIESYLFRPEIFFAKCVILVEGATDASVIRATAEILKGKTWLEDNNILIIDMNGIWNFKKYTSLCNAYDIKYVALIDKDQGCLECSYNIFYAHNNLEEELKAICVKVGLDPENYINHKKDRKKATRYYEILYKIYQKEGENVLKDSVFGKLLNRVEELIK
jgi:predicted ATP-dependent endonuclease of OLD family